MKRLTYSDGLGLLPWVFNTEAFKRLAAYENSGLEPEEIKEIAQAKREGRLVVPPCKTGDTVYQLRGKKHALGVGISPRIVSCILAWSDGDYSLIHQGAEPCAKKDFGKTWFLTREEAEAALYNIERSSDNET